MQLDEETKEQGWVEASVERKMKIMVDENMKAGQKTDKECTSLAG